MIIQEFKSRKIQDEGEDLDFEWSDECEDFDPESSQPQTKPRDNDGLPEQNITSCKVCVELQKPFDEPGQVLVLNCFLYGVWKGGNVVKEIEIMNYFLL